MNENNYNQENQNPIGQTTYPNQPVTPNMNQAYPEQPVTPDMNQAYQNYEQPIAQQPYPNVQPVAPDMNQVYPNQPVSPDPNQVYQNTGYNNQQGAYNNPYASMYDNNYQTNNSTFSQVYTNNETQKINPYPNLTKADEKDGKKKKKSGKLLVIILLIIVFIMVAVLVVMKGDFLKKHSSNKGNGVDANVDVKVTEQKDTKTNEVTEEDAKASAVGFVADVEHYAAISQTSLATADKGYDKQIPVATEGNVTCSSNDGTTWTGTVAPGSESCDNFMDAAVAKTSYPVPTKAKIIINTQGKFQEGSWLKYDKYYCSYNGTEIEKCSTEKIN